jgi:hypothetical protein
MKAHELGGHRMEEIIERVFCFVMTKGKKEDKKKYVKILVT